MCSTSTVLPGVIQGSQLLYPAQDKKSIAHDGHPLYRKVPGEILEDYCHESTSLLQNSGYYDI